MLESATASDYCEPIRVPPVEPHSLEALTALGTACRVESRHALFRRGDAGTDVFRVERGHVKVSVTSSDGRDLTFGVMGPGEFLGEIAAFGDGRRTASVVTLDETEFLRVRKSDLVHVLKRDSTLASSFFGLMARRLRQTSETRERLRFCNLPSQLAKVLLCLADRFGTPIEVEPTASGTPADDTVRIDVRLSQRELGSLVGTSRVSANRQLCRWRASGILADDKGRIVVLRPTALERIATRARGEARTVH